MESDGCASPCLVLRKIPADYFVNFDNNLINFKNKEIFKDWEKYHKSVMVMIQNHLATSFVRAEAEKKFTFTDQNNHEVLCKTMYEITKSWKQNPQRQEDFSYICRGHFKEKWEFNMEREILTKMGLEYEKKDGEEGERKGSVARLCTRRRTEMVKNWNTCGKRKHGNQCLVTRELITKENKYKKRKKDTFYFTNTPTVEQPKKEEHSSEREGTFSQDSDVMIFF